MNPVLTKSDEITPRKKIIVLSVFFTVSILVLGAFVYPWIGDPRSNLEWGPALWVLVSGFGSGFCTLFGIGLTRAFRSCGVGIKAVLVATCIGALPLIGMLSLLIWVYVLHGWTPTR